MSFPSAPDGAPRDRQLSHARSAARGQHHADFDQSAGWCRSGQSSAHYHATAARARWLQMQATTPRLKQYLERTIARSEELAAEGGKVPKHETERRKRHEARLRFD
jgi:hypothetical protein